MNDATRRNVRRALEESWSNRTCLVFDPLVPSANHCAQTAIILQRKFDGDILMTSVRDGLPHFYNRIDGQREDFTADQFTAIASDTWDVMYEDKLVLVADAMHFTDSAQVEALANSFEVHFAER